MKNLFKVKRHSGTLARNNDGPGPVDEKYLKSRSVENQPISPNTLAKAPRIRGAVGVPSVCPYCAVGCSQMVYVKSGKIIDIEGNYESPINEGPLCPKGANTFQLTVNPHRVQHVLYRAPYSDHWEQRPLEWAMDRIAERVKAARDVGYADKGETGYHTGAVTNLGTLGGATLD